MEKPNNLEECDNFGQEKSENVTGDIDLTKSFGEINRPPLRYVDKYVRPRLFGLSARYTVAFMAMIGFIVKFGMRCNLGAAKLERQKSYCRTCNSTGVENLHWDAAVESMVDSSFFWSYIITQIPGGLLASVFPASRVFGIALFTSSVLHMFLPAAMKLDTVTVLLIIRVLQGLVEGLTHSALHGIWRFWAPPQERSRLVTIALCGSYAGIVIGLPLSNILAQHISWQAPFYFYSIFGIFWYFCWLWLVFDRPRVHPTITIEEMYYIESSLDENTGQTMLITSIPFRKIMKSKPVHAIIVANFCRSWNFFMVVLYQSKFMYHMFHYSTSESGTITALRYFILSLIIPIGGVLADHLRKPGRMSTTSVRKLFNCVGFGMEGLFFLIVAHASTASGAMLAITLGVAFTGFATSGYNVNHLDIAPKYASILMGLSNGIGSLGGVFCPILIDFIAENWTLHDWSFMFILGAIVHLFGMIFYCIFASGELQPWAETKLSRT